MKRTLILLVGFLFGVCVSTGAFGDTITIDSDEYTLEVLEAVDDFAFLSENSGSYLGTITDWQGGTNTALEVAIVQAVFIHLNPSLECTISDYGKVETPEKDDGNLYVTYDDYSDQSIYGDNAGKLYSGTWATYPETMPTDATMLDLYTLKSSTQLAIYQVLPAAAAGTWNTEHLYLSGDSVKELSHLTGMTSDCPAPVPEPASMLLMGAGLAGLGVFRKKFKKA